MLDQLFGMSSDGVYQSPSNAHWWEGKGSPGAPSMPGSSDALVSYRLPLTTYLPSPGMASEGLLSNGEPLPSRASVAQASVTVHVAVPPGMTTGQPLTCIIAGRCFRFAMPPSAMGHPWDALVREGEEHAFPLRTCVAVRIPMWMPLIKQSPSGPTAVLPRAEDAIRQCLNDLISTVLQQDCERLRQEREQRRALRDRQAVAGVLNRLVGKIEKAQREIHQVEREVGQVVSRLVAQLEAGLENFDATAFARDQLARLDDWLVSLGVPVGSVIDWAVRVDVRRSGESAGTTDIYFFVPSAVRTHDHKPT